MEIGKLNNNFYYISSTVKVVIPVSDIVQKMYRDSKRQVHLLVKGASGYFWVIFKYSDVKVPIFTNYLDFRQWFEDNLFEVPVGVAISDDAPDLPSPYPFWLDTSEDPEVLFINVNNDYWLEYAGGGALVDLVDLSDVDATDIGNDKILVYNSTTGKHEYQAKPTGGGGGLRRSETLYAPSYISYLAFAPGGSLETDAVWTITKRVGSADGTIISNVQYLLKKWTERNLL